MVIHITKKLSCFALLGFFFLTQQVNAAIIEQQGRSPVSVVEVLDYNCIHCHNQELTMLDVRREFKQVTFKVLPVAILKPSSIEKAAVAYELALNYPNAFQGYHLALLADGRSSDSYLSQYFSKDLVNKIINNAKDNKAIFNQMQYGQSLLDHYDSGTPLLLIYDRHISKDKPVMVFKGETNFNQLERGIDHYVRRNN
ncbi:DsbA family protein [Cysteiniphilum halobium]|uniref:DsbA family protein n=1 Tax=Cysteiniphilum halobium TaxID=2219059 RepID=UPI000E653554|nr:thioredoxin domain-containing protein [Cysteiniphilum halobium]